MHSQINAVFNSFYAGIKIFHLSLGYHHEKLNTNFLWGLNYFNYGNIQQTDASGNILGNFKPNDWVMHLSASRSYMEKWNYGATLKFINSNYGQYRSNGIALDVGVLYADSSKQFSASALVKNMGFQLKTYQGTTADDLPFDLQIGLTKRLEKAPFSFSITAHHLDPAFSCPTLDRCLQESQRVHMAKIIVHALRSLLLDLKGYHVLFQYPQNAATQIQS